MDPLGSITWIHQDQSLESTRIHCTAPLGPITWIYQNPSPGSTRIHHVNPPGCIIYGSSRIHHLNPTGSIMCIQWDPSRGSTRIHHMDPPGSVMWINKIKSENLSIFILFRAQKKYFWSTLAPTCNSAQLELGAKVAPKTYLLLLLFCCFLSPTINIQFLRYLGSWNFVNNLKSQN